MQPSESVETGVSVVRVSAYPHRAAETVAWEKQELERAGCRYHLLAGWDDPAGQNILRDADVVFSNFERIDEGRLDKLGRCRVIVMGSVGLDGVDTELARTRGVTICNMPDVCVEEVAEHTMALLLGSARKLALLDRQVKSGLWVRDSLEPMPRLSGSQLGLVGAGRIGRAVAARARAFGMTVVAYDPFLDPSVLRDSIELATLDAVCATSDFLSIHVPLAPTTRHLIAEPELRAMKAGATIINTSRGPLIDERALVRALEEGWIRAAALDVFETEPPSAGHPFFGMENVLLTPHSGGFSDVVVETIPRLAVGVVMTLLRGEAVPSQALIGERPAPIEQTTPSAAASLSMSAREWLDAATGGTVDSGRLLEHADVQGYIAQRILRLWDAPIEKFAPADVYSAAWTAEEAE